MTSLWQGKGVKNIVNKKKILLKRDLLIISLLLLKIKKKRLSFKGCDKEGQNKDHKFRVT